MGQSVSATAGLGRHDSFQFPSSRFLAAPQMIPPAEIDGEEGDVDFTGEIPDECLAYIFQFIGCGDRRRCSLVCRRWLRVDGQSRSRLALNALGGLAADVRSLFARFDSVTKLALRCDRKSASIGDDALVMISIRCRSLTGLKLRGCRLLTDAGMAEFARNCKGLKKISCVSCCFGAKALNAILDNCAALEELSAKRLRGCCDGAEMIGPGAAASSVRAVCLKEIINGRCFELLITGARNLKTLKIIHCLGDWDHMLQMIGKGNPTLTEIHLERLQVTDLGFSAISKCSSLEILHMVKTPECSNSGLISVAENCKLLRKLHIDGWRTNRIGDEGLISVARHCTVLQELVLIGVNSTHLSFSAIASSCQKLERLALCGSDSIGDAEIACIAAKCAALRKLCIKGCPISDFGIEALAWGCPSLVKLKVKKCRGVSGEITEWLQERRRSLIVNLDSGEVEVFDAGGVAEESGLELPHAQVLPAGAPSSSNDRIGH